MKKKYYLIRFCILIASFSFLRESSFAKNQMDSTRASNEVIAHNLGPNVNLKAEDFGAYLFGNGLTMYFVSRRTSSGSHLDRFWVVKRKTRNSAWEKAEYSMSLNNEYVVGGLTIDDSGKIYYATNYQTTEHNDVNIWEGTIENKTLNIKALPSPVKTERWESQPSVTGNGKDLYFASNRDHQKGSNGRVEIFVTHKNLEGKWSEPKDLGPQINFGTYNGTPFISPDNNILFFTCSKKLDSKKKIYMALHAGPNDDDWSEAISLPGEINSDGDNIFPMIASDGKTMYFSSNRSGGYGEFDIYEATLPEDIQNKIFHSFPGY